MYVPVTVIGSVVVVVVVVTCLLCFLAVELVCANASGTIRAQTRVTIVFFTVMPPCYVDVHPNFVARGLAGRRGVDRPSHALAGFAMPLLELISYL